MSEAPPDPYFLRTARLGFRHWTEADLALARQLWGDPDVTRFIGGPFPEIKIEERLQREISTHRDNGIQYWPIFLLVTGEHVGCCGLRPYVPAEAIVEIGFHLRKAFWGRGLGTEAAQTVIEYAFISLAVKGLFAGHHPENQASRQLLIRLGFRYVRDEYYAPTGLNHPSYLLTR